MNELFLVLKVKSNLNKEMKSAEKSVKKLEKQTDSSVKNMEKSFKSLSNAIKGAYGSMALKAGADIIKTSEKMAFGYEILKAKSSDVTDQLERASEASFGLVNKYDLVSSANKALSFGIDLSNGRLEKLIKLSTKTAMVMGTDTKSAFDDLIVGVARESKMILDNLGVMVNLQQVYGDYAKTLGITTKQLTKQQRQTALLDEVNRQLEKSTKAVTDEMVKQGTVGTRALKKVETAWQETKMGIAQGFVWLGETIGESFAILQIGVEKAARLTKKDLDEIDKHVEKIVGTQALIDKIIKDSGIDEERRKMIARNKVIEEQNKKEEEEYQRMAKIRAKIIKARLRREKEEEKARIAAIRKIKEQEVADVIKLQKEIDGYDEMSRTDRIIQDIAYKKQRKELLRKSNADLLAMKIENADKMDKIDFNKQAKEDLLKSEEEFNNAILELARRNAEQKKVINLEEYKSEKELDKRAREEKLKHFNSLRRFGARYLDAIISGNADKIPEILAQQEKMFGQELIWDGVKTLWMGNAKNALFPGLGANAIAVGLTEIGIGTAMTASGMSISSALSSSSDTGAKERNTLESKEKEYNLNMSVSLFGSKTEAKRNLNNLLVG